MHNNVITHRFMNVVFTKIDFVIQKCLITQLIVRLFSIYVQLIFDILEERLLECLKKRNSIYLNLYQCALLTKKKKFNPPYFNKQKCFVFKLLHYEFLSSYYDIVYIKKQKHASNCITLR